LESFTDAIPTQISLAFAKDSEFADCFNYHLLALKQSGEVDKVKHFWLKDNSPEDYSHRIFLDQAEPLSYNNLFFPSAVLALGCLAAAFLAVVERVHVNRLPTGAEGCP